jgi:ankyrin repeat protein
VGRVCMPAASGGACVLAVSPSLPPPTRSGKGKGSAGGDDSVVPEASLPAGALLTVLLESGKPVVPSPTSGNTPLHFAVQARDLELTRAMLAGKAPGAPAALLATANLAGRTPLLALLRSAKEGEGEGEGGEGGEAGDAPPSNLLRLVKALVGAGAALGARDVEGNTALHLAGEPCG